MHGAEQVQLTNSKDGEVEDGEDNNIQQHGD
jgi:hypothetical protein